MLITEFSMLFENVKSIDMRGARSELIKNNCLKKENILTKAETKAKTFMP